MSEDEFDNIPDDFADIQGVDWAQILAGPSGSIPTSIELPEIEESIPSIPGRPGSSDSSADYFEDDYDDLDPSLLAELDRIEEEFTEATQHPHFVGGGTISDSRPSHYLLTAPNTHPQMKRKDLGADSQSGEEIPGVFFKKQHLDDTACPTSPQGKGKAKAKDVLQPILSAYEDEIICPICCDFYAFAHISSPCGHSFCGSCGREWHMKNKSCPICRTHLKTASPMIPNIAIDNVVEKHIRALALTGDQDWEPGGFKAEEWHKRKQTWRNGAVGRENIVKSSSIPQPTTFIPPVINLNDAIFNQPPFHIQDNLETDPTYEDTSDIELIPRPIHRARRRRRRTTGPTVVNLG